MAEGGGACADFDVGVQELVIALANPFKEVQHVRRGVFVQRLLRHGLFVLLPISGACSTGGLSADVSGSTLIQLEAAMIDDEESQVAEEDVAHVVGTVQA